MNKKIIIYSFLKSICKELYLKVKYAQGKLVILGVEVGVEPHT